MIEAARLVHHDSRVESLFELVPEDREFERNEQMLAGLVQAVQELVLQPLHLLVLAAKPASITLITRI